MSDVPRPARPGYVSTIRNLDEACRRQEELFATRNVPNTELRGMPDNDDQRHWLAGVLFDAILDVSNTFEPPTSQQYRYIASPDRFPSEVVDIVSWRLLECMEDSQRGQNRLEPWYTTAGPKYEKYPSFSARFAKVEESLRKSKATASALFTHAMFIERFSWNPTMEHHRKCTNKDLNDKKTALQAIGFAQSRRANIVQNEDGDLVDQDGVRYGTRRPLPTEAARRLTANARRRARPSERARVTDRLVAPVRAGAGAGANTNTPDNNHSASPAESQTSENQPIPSPTLGSPARRSAQVSRQPLRARRARRARRAVPPSPEPVGPRANTAIDNQTIANQQPHANQMALPNVPMPYIPVFQSGPVPQSPDVQGYQEPRVYQQAPGDSSYPRFQPRDLIPDAEPPHGLTHRATPRGVNQQDYHGAFGRPELGMYAQGAPEPTGSSEQQQEGYPTQRGLSNFFEPQPNTLGGEQRQSLYPTQHGPNNFLEPQLNISRVDEHQGLYAAQHGPINFLDPQLNASGEQGYTYDQQDQQDPQDAQSPVSFEDFLNQNQELYE
ncbi:hypothetical protein GGS24DRAFT_506183 [Hypoxylon argillaceum]|nr:hypothetical protein GGS24DRAFT_506183 [Hypoxylon argillaceum]